jgi:hypothetical protein
MEQGFGYRFYNAGKRISEMIKFSTTNSALGQAEHGDGISSWPLEAPEKGWFFVPAEVDCGTETIRVTFKDDIRRKFGYMGVVLLDARHNSGNEDPEKDLQAVASSEEAVIARAEKLWELYTLGVIEKHLADCDQALASGGRPRKASGFTKYCFKMHGKIDPGDTYAHTADVKPGNDQLLGALTLALIAMAKGEKIDTAMLEKAATPSGASGKPVTSGIATGEIKKPITGGDGWEKAKDVPKGKSDRGKEAAAAL